MSDLKKALKAARESLAANDYAAVLQHCKAALVVDKACYEAYV
jgi:hypothetical protein